MATKKNAQEVVEIKSFDIRTVDVRIRGTAPLISHKWSEKAKKMILDTQTQETKVDSKREKKIPARDFINSAYWLTPEPTGDTDEECIENFENAVKNGARWGFPATAFKQAAIMAASRNGLDLKGTQIRASFFIEGEGPNQLVEIKGSVPHIREDMVRVGGISKAADIRHRAQFDDWYADLRIRYNKGGAISLEQIINLINLSGFCGGVGEWRPEKDGSFGTFAVESKTEVEG